MKSLTTEQAQMIIDEAFAAAKKAEADFIQRNGEPPFCGFAWVNIKPGNCKIAKMLKAADQANTSYAGGVDVWNPGKSATQSMDVKQFGARAFANVMKTYGIKAYMDSRAD